jgi:hypothetical protein
MARKGYGARAVGVVAVWLLLLLAAGGCSVDKDGVSDKPPPKGSDCNLAIVRLLG